MSTRGIADHGELNLPERAPDAGELAAPVVAAASGVQSHGALPENLVGCVDDWPADMAQRHDVYLHGQPKS